jgi:hypothetical protein
MKSSPHIQQRLRRGLRMKDGAHLANEGSMGTSGQRGNVRFGVDCSLLRKAAIGQNLPFHDAAA